MQHCFNASATSNQKESTYMCIYYHRGIKGKEGNVRHWESTNDVETGFRGWGGQGQTHTK